MEPNVEWLAEEAGCADDLQKPVDACVRELESAMRALKSMASALKEKRRKDLRQKIEPATARATIGSKQRVI